MTPQTLSHYHPQVVMWNAQTGQEIVRLRNLPYTPQTAYPIRGTQNMVLLDTENIAHFWSTQHSREVFTVAMGAKGQHTFESFSVSPDGKYVSFGIADGFFDGRVEVYDLATGKLHAHNDHAWLFQPQHAFSPDGRYRLWADNQQNVHIVELATGKEAQVLKSIGGDFTRAAFSPDSKRIVTGTNIGVIKLWNVETGAELMLLSNHKEEVTDLGFSPDGTRLAATAATLMQSVAYVWDAPMPAAAEGQRP